MIKSPPIPHLIADRLAACLDDDGGAQYLLAMSRNLQRAALAVGARPVDRVRWWAHAQAQVEGERARHRSVS